MSKDKISDYSSTSAGANLNTDIAGVNIDEGCPPSGINNAIRALMSQIKDLQTGVSGDTIPIAAGGTGSSTDASARAALGLGSLAVKSTIDSSDITAGAVTTAKIAADAIDGTKVADGAINSEHITANAIGATQLNVTGNGTAGQSLTSDGDGSFSWSDAGGGFFTTSVTMTGNTTITSSDNGKVYYTATGGYILTLPAPAGGNDSYAFGVINDSTGDLIIKANNTATEYIGDWLGSAIVGTKKECIIVGVGSNWKVIATDVTSSINVVQYNTSGSYTPDASVGSFLVCLGGATRGIGGSSYSASGGGGYAEKIYNSPTGTYNFTLGAGGTAPTGTGGTSTFDTNVIVNGATQSGGSGSGGDYNKTGGSGGNSAGGKSGGGGAGAGRAGDGGNGASGSTNGGGGGGTGGNASGGTGGIAATAQDASVYSLSALFTSFTFGAGGNNNNNLGGDGASGGISYTNLGGTNGSLRGGLGGRAANSSQSGDQALMSIVEFKG